MNVKALLIDDEVHILNNLKIVLPWEEMQIDIVGTARNGAEGLDFVRQHEPDIILCDIRMPVMDGMEFLRQARKMGCESEILMLTGYQEFEYARIALQHGVRDYISKPINYEELEDTVRKVADIVRSRKLEKTMAERRWGKVISLAYEKMMFDVLMGFTSGNSSYFVVDDDHQADQLVYSLLLIDLDGYAQRTVTWSENERRLWNFAVRNVLQDAINNDWLKYAVLQMREGEWCILLQFYKDRFTVSAQDVSAWAAAIQQAVREHVKLTVSVAWDIGPIPMTSLSHTYKRLQRVLLLHADNEQLVPVDESSTARQAASVSQWHLVEEIVSGMKQNDKTKVERGLQELQASLLHISEQSLVRAEKFLHYVIIHLLREMRELELLSTAEEEAMWDKLQHSVSVKDLVNVISQLVHHTKEHALNKKSSELLMISARDYIQRNLGSDIGIDEIADYLGISCSYFSLLFKNHFGETFVEYVTKQRMELAKSLLTMTDKSVTQIGNMVGYSERRYFTKVFQKYAGMTPSEFREKHAPIER
ncbi:response regulator transcription factor [Paenibacillus sp. 481]|uniref:response regulator transcription factor n=1 Tax=Paenibacillus sp. 481 TaxID=2835869 RepID=UPI001E3C640F|nr:response regulator [Paenibacillus sp. 481]UHA72846.1 response regulator [Paenibacillus sp. 481]